MPAELAYDFRVIGLPAVKTALRSVERAAIAANRRMMRSAQVRAGERLPATGAAMGVVAGRRMRGAASPAAAAAAMRITTGRHSWLQRQVDAGAKREMSNYRQQSRTRWRDMRSEQKERSRALRERIRERRKARLLEERRAAKTQRDKFRKEAREAAKLEHAVYARSQSVARSRAQVRTAMMGAAGRGVTGALGGIGRYALMTTGLMGGFAAGAAIGNAKRVEQAATALANQAYREGSGVSRKEIAADVTRTARTVGVGTGLGAEGMIRGFRSFTEISGNLPAALQMAQFMADIADATDADIGDVGRTGGQIMQAMMARNVPQEEAVKQTTEIFRTMAAQAKIGSIEFRDLATQMGALISSTTRFEGRIDETAATMGAFAQLAKAGGASSTEEAMTAIKRFADDLVKNSARYEKMLSPEQRKRGFSYFNEKGQLRAPEKLVMDILDVTGGDLRKLSRLFNIRSMKAVEPAFTIFRDVIAAEGGGEAGKRAALAKLAEFQQARMGEGELRGSAAAARQTTGRRLSIAMESFNQQVGEQLLPVVADLVPQFEKLIPLIAEGAKWLGRFIQHFQENPFKVIFQILATKVALDVARAGIGTAIRNTVVGNINASMGVGAAGTVATGTRAGAAGATVVATGGGWRGGRPRRGGGRAGGGRAPAPVPAMGMGGRVASITTSALTVLGVGLTVGTLVADLIEAKGISDWQRGEDELNKRGRAARYAASSGRPELIKEEKERAEKYVQEQRKEYVKEQTSLASGGYMGGYGAIPFANMPKVSTEKEDIKGSSDAAVRLRSAMGFVDILNGAAEQVDFSEFMAEMGNTTQQFNTLGVAVGKFRDELDKSGGPNRGNSPTRNNS